MFLLAKLNPIDIAQSEILAVNIPVLYVPVKSAFQGQKQLNTIDEQL